MFRRSLTLLLCRVLGVSLAIGSMASTAASAAEWPQFRGPDRSGGSAAETDLARTWPEAGPPRLWHRPLGDGYSGIAIIDDRLFTLFADDDKVYVGAFAVADGGEIWKREIDDEPFSGSFGRGPRSTPTVVGELVYALSGRGHLVAVTVATGEMRWQVDLFEDYGFFGPQRAPMVPPQGELQLPFWGYTHSPLVEGDLVIAETGRGDGTSLVAFDRYSGEERWTALDHPISYNSPVAITFAGRRHVIAIADTDLVSLSLDGDLEWRVPWAPTIGQPLFVSPDKIFVTTVSKHGIEGGAMLVQMSASGSRVSAKPVWRSQSLHSQWSSPVVIGDHLYGFEKATFRCLGLADGERVWAHRGLGRGTVIAAAGLLIVYSDRGVVTLAEASPEDTLLHVKLFSGFCIEHLAVEVGVVGQHAVDRVKEFTHDSDLGLHLLFAPGDELISEGLDPRFEDHGVVRRHVESGSEIPVSSLGDPRGALYGS